MSQVHNFLEQYNVFGERFQFQGVHMTEYLQQELEKCTQCEELMNNVRKDEVAYMSQHVDREANRRPIVDLASHSGSAAEYAVPKVKGIRTAGGDESPHDPRSEDHLADQRRYASSRIYTMEQGAIKQPFNSKGPKVRHHIFEEGHPIDAELTRKLYLQIEEGNALAVEKRGLRTGREAPSDDDHVTKQTLFHQSPAASQINKSSVVYPEGSSQLVGDRRASAHYESQREGVETEKTANRSRVSDGLEQHSDLKTLNSRQTAQAPEVVQAEERQIA